MIVVALLEKRFQPGRLWMKHGERVAVVADALIVDPSTILTDAAVMIAEGRVEAQIAQAALDAAVPRVGGRGA